MNELLKIFDKDDLYKRSGWFSKDCEELIDTLDKFGLCVIDKKTAEEMIRYFQMTEDDGR